MTLSILGNVPVFLMGTDNAAGPENCDAEIGDCLILVLKIISNIER